MNDILYHLYPGALPVESIYKGLQLFSQLESTAPLTFDMDGNSTVCPIMTQDNGISVTVIDHC